MIKATLVVLITLLFSACAQKPKKEPVSSTAAVCAYKQKVDSALDTDTAKQKSSIASRRNLTLTYSPDTARKVRATDYTFFSDSVLHGHRALLSYYFTQYGSTTCEAFLYDRTELIKIFEGLSYLGSIRKKKLKTSDSVFVLPSLTRCGFSNEPDMDGEVYYFTDSTLPRLPTDSYCCHPANIFLVGDIDEDGISEIGQYYSSCASRYKSLRVYSLKNRQWKEVGNCVYDLFYADLKQPFQSFVRKVGKRKFKMLEITDLTTDRTKIGKRNWKPFTI